MRKYGTASVEEHPKGSGKFRVRARIDNKLVTVASQLSEKSAHATADTYTEIRGSENLSHGLTVDNFGGGFLDRREASGIRGIAQERSKWRVAIEKDAIGSIALAALRRSDVIAWRDRMMVGHARQTVKNAVNLLRSALGEALDRELVETNVAGDVKFGRKKGTPKEDLDGVLFPDEQLVLLGAVPDAHKPLVAIGLLTGLRWSELSWLRREDVMDGELLIRRSTGGGPTKSGKPRRVPLLGPAQIALAVQLASLPARCPWIFPSADGTPRKNRPNAWLKWVAAAGIKRRVRWHDLRHTCATSLLAGWWSPDGTRWTLDEVCSMMGHSSIQVTERYARKLDETLKIAAKKISFPGGNGAGGNGAKALSKHRLPKPWVADSNSAGSAAENKPFGESVAGLLGTSGELPRSLKRALKRVNPRSDESLLTVAVARAWAPLLAGDKKHAFPELKKAARALERLAGGSQ